MADQLGRSVGDMYQGAFIPGLMLAALYAVFVFGKTVVQPEAAPALPPDALNLREESGRAGYLSLLVIIVLTVAAGYVLTWYMHPIWAAGLVGLGAYLAALADWLLRLHLLSRLAEQVVIVMMPPLGADLSGARHDLRRHRDADRGRRDGRDRRVDHGVRETPARP